MARSPKSKAWLAGLLMVSVGVLLLPADWTGGLISVVQVFVPFQHAASAVMNTGTRRVEWIAS